MIDPTLPEHMVVHMLSTFVQFGIEDTLENRLEFLEDAIVFIYRDPVLGSPQYLYSHIAIKMVIFDLKAEIALEKKLKAS